jgi:hypothetical protein
MLRWTAILCLICAPSAYVAWQARDIPQLGLLADDAIYLVSGKSLATGQGYRILSLPGAPVQTKYPPIYPLLLSLVWRINPQFPQNMPMAALLAWVMLPLLVTMARLEFGKLGLSARHATMLCAMMALSAPVVWFSINLMPDLALVSTVLASTWLADSWADSDGGGSGNGWRAGAAGALGGVAYLLKSAALPLLLTSPLLYLLRKRKRSAALFLAGMLPFVAGWTWWTVSHRAAPGDSTWTFYTNYFAYQSMNVQVRDYPLVVWVNLKTLWASAGELIAAPALGGPLGRIPAYLGATVAVAGMVLLARRKGVTHYHAFALGLVPMLAMWHYPPVQRFALPLLPLLLAGISFAGVEAWRIVSAGGPGRRTAIAWATLAALGALTPLALTGVYIKPLAGISGLAGDARRQFAAVLPEYRWIKDNTPPDAAFAASDDAVLYLYTGRPAMSLHIPPKLLYREDRPAIAQEYRAMDAFAARNHLRYLLRTESDFEQDFTPDMGRQLVDGLLADPRRFRLAHRSPQAATYEARVDKGPA